MSKILPNPRHEKFAQALAKGKTADEAYQEAGYKPNRGNATTLKANQSISDRVSELQAGAAAKAEWSAADRLRTLSEIVGRTAMTDPRVAVSAISEANKMQGSHAPTKSELTGKNGGPIETKDTTAEALIDEAKRLGIDPTVILGEGGRTSKT